MSSTGEHRMMGDLLAPEITQLIDRRQTEQARDALAHLLEPEIADVLLAMDLPRRAAALELLPPERAADVFSHFERDQQQELIETWGEERSAQILNEMEVDDRVDFLEDAPSALADSLLARMEPGERAETEAILGYPEDSAGREMTPDFLTVQPAWSVTQALEHIRRCGADAESLDTLYVVDGEGRLLNHIRLRQLVLADTAARVESLLDPEGRTVHLAATDDREALVRAAEHYDIPVVPVVGDGDKLVGIVTFDDVADVAEEEVTEDMQKMGGMEALDLPYMSASVPELVRKRVIWLMVLFGGGLLTVMAMGMFRESIEKVAVLALFVPLIIASGGNSGSQAATLMIRSLALGEVALSDWRRVFVRELASGLLLGAVLGFCGLVVGAVVSHMGFPDLAPDYAHALRFGAAIGIAVLGVVLVGTLTGSILPFILQR
ncbi:MAG: magnesium transporter, partial [Phycisphaerae bacterium]|nr:magnesium transporter [Phycisphaerae bacterium]